MDFKKLIVYQKALDVYSDIDAKVLPVIEVDRVLKDQLKRASVSIVLNIAEGTSRFSPADRKDFYVISRGSAFECVAVLDLISRKTKNNFPEIESVLDEISRILFKMILNLNANIVKK